MRVLTGFKYVVFATIACSAGIAAAQDITQQGGDLSTDIPGRNAIQVAAPNLASQEREDLQLSGFEQFHKNFEKSEGLGPNFTDVSCGGCHVQNGKGPISFNIRGIGSSVVVKVGLPSRDRFGFHKAIPGVGKQLQDHDIAGRTKYKIRLQWKTLRGTYPDRTPYSLRSPSLSFTLPNISQRSIRYSLRMSPILIGMGLLGDIPEWSLLAAQSNQASSRTGISGRVNRVLDATNNISAIGRFGFKAGQPTLEQQTALALFNDIGITNQIFNDPRIAPEYPTELFNRLMVYQLIPGVPKATSQDDPTVIYGKGLFQSTGCSDCHTMTQQTGEDILNPELSNQTIHPFTDLLLHDMGSELGDNFMEGAARSSEWRTTPLWGLGFSSTVSSVRPIFLHDGRARTIEEAILWHGGEGKRSRDRFMKLKKTDRAALVRFLRSL